MRVKNSIFQLSLPKRRQFAGGQLITGRIRRWQFGNIEKGSPGLISGFLALAEGRRPGF
jgi:hypothetical protein